VTAYSSPVAMFNRYRYANSNPYRFTDPDGRRARACGQDWDCRVSQHQGGPTFSSIHIRSIARNPQKEVARLNATAGSYSYGSERQAARFAANRLLPLTKATGREAGANVAEVGGEKPFTTNGYKLGSPTSVGMPIYDGPGSRSAWVHTHPNNTAVSGWQGISSRSPNYGNQGFWDRLGNAGDTWVGITTGTAIYAAALNGALTRFDARGFNNAYHGGAYNVHAKDFIEQVP
jgi:hypothetical protein